MKKKLIMATMLIGLALCIPTHAHASTGIVKSQTQLEKTLADRKWVLCTIKGTRLVYASLIFYDFWMYYLL